MIEPTLPRGQRWARVDPQTGEWVDQRIIGHDLETRQPIWRKDGLPIIHAHTYLDGRPLRNRRDKRHPELVNPHIREARKATARRRLARTQHGRVTAKTRDLGALEVQAAA